MLTDLATTPIAETLRRLSAERRSGDLQVRSGKVVKTVFFDHGRVVFAASNLKKDRLGEALIALGRITDDDFNRAAALMKKDRQRRFGEALVQAGVLDKKELGGSVARQVKRIVLSLFELGDGVAAFEERKCAIPLEYMVSISLHRILYMGIKSMSSKDLVLTGLGDLDRQVTLATVPPFRFGIRKCSSEELEILEQSKRRVTLRRLGWAPGGLALPRLRAAYGLVSSGILTRAEPQAQEEPQPIIHMETTTFLLSALRSRPDPSSEEAIQQEIQDELQRSAKLDREAWLKVSQTAPRDELVKALEEKMERYHALLDAIGDNAALKTDIEVILGRASSMLRMIRQAPATGPVERPASLLPVSPHPSPPPLAAPVVAAPPAAETTPPGPAEPPPVAAETEKATSPPPESSSEPARDRDWPPKGASQELVPPTGGPGSSDFSGPALIEHLLMEAHVRMTVADYANAVKVYQKLVDVAPNVGAYRGRLAIAMACYPRTSKQAEREFIEAVRLDPDNADLHFQFGLYYKAMKQRSRALAEMRTAVRLNPKHKNAREELEVLSPKDSALTSLKKLFR